MAEEKKATVKKLTFRQRLAKAQYEISKTELKKEGHNPFYNSTYSTLDNYNNTVQPALEKNAIYQTFKFCSMEGTGTILKLIVADAHSDEMMESCLRLPEYKKDIHSLGSEITYSKRLLLSGFFNLSTSENDDDGNSAMNTPHKNPTQKSTTSVPSSGGNPAKPKIEEGTQPTKDFWFGDDRKYLYKFQKECESVGIDKGTFWDFAFDNYKTKLGKLKAFDDIHFLPSDDKERLMSDIKNGLNKLQKEEEQPDLVEVDNDGGIGDDDIPF